MTTSVTSRRVHRRSIRATPPVTPQQRLADGVVAAIMCVIALTVCLFGIGNATKISVLDEYTHIDYVWQIQHGSIPAKGDVISEEVLHDVVCRERGPIPYDAKLQCGSAFAADPNNFGRTKGVNYNEFHPPLYYGFAAGIAAVIAPIAGVDFITSVRLASALLVSVGIGAFYLAIRSWRIRRLAAIAGTTMLIATPAVMYAGMIVTNDAVNVLAGAGTSWLLGQVFVHKRFPIWQAAVIMALVAGSKAIATVPLIALGVLLGFWGLVKCGQHRLRQGMRSIAMATSMAAVLGAVTYTWSKFQADRGNPLAVNPVVGVNTKPFSGTPVDEFLGNMFVMFNAGRGIENWLPHEIHGWGLSFTGALTQLLISAAPFVGLVLFKRRDPALAATGVLIIGFFLAPVIVQVQALLSTGMVFPVVSPRYAMSLVPLAGLVWALVLDRRKAERWVAPLLLLCVGLLLGTLARCEPFIRL